MARISLRAYNGDIEAMVDKNQIDEAFAHCRYILQIYPKHIDTYRLMGKALLEAQRFGDAADVFHRVLSSVPDDFIAHLGMSIIREDESNLDAAIWHMERAFEVQPSNAAVQVELRRLYGLRDGITPQKIQLTRGALARMSAKSNLYSQAIAELRTALSSDPQRPDLQVVLADMYFQTGANMEAIETCNSLINKLPYCLVANRILADVLPETERADQAAEYSSRLGELNPYYRHISPVAPTLEQVPDGAVTIERFEYSDQTGDVSQPAWAASLGVDFEDQEAESEPPAPDWLRESAPEGEPPPGEQEADLPQADLEEEQELESEQAPDWMDESAEVDQPAPSADMAGLGMAAGAAALGELLSDQGEDEEEDTETGSEEIPDWMESQQADLAPDEMEDSLESASGGEELPDWMRDDEEESLPAEDLADLTAAAGEAAVQQAAEEKSMEDETVEGDQEAEPLPDWMAEEITSVTEPEAAESEASELVMPDQSPFESESTPPLSEEAQEDGTPEWISETEDNQVTETPAWLREAMEETPPEDQEPLEGIAAEESVSEDLDAMGVELEEDLGDELPDEEDEESIEAGEVVGAALAGAALAAGLEADEGDEETSGTEEEIPDWLRDLGDQVPDQPETGKSAPVFDDQLEAELPPPETTEQVTSEFEAAGEEPLPAAEILDQSAADLEQPLETDSEFPESIPDWLSEVSPEEVSDELEESAEGMDIVKAEIPVWLKKMEAQHRAEMTAAGEYETREDFETELTDLSGEDVPSWLVSAMEPELAPETEIPVEDVSEIIAGSQPEEMEAEFIPEAEELLEEAQPEPAVEEIDLEKALEEAEPEAALEEFEPEMPMDQAEAEPTAEEMPMETGQVEDLVEEPAGEVEAEPESIYTDKPPVETALEGELEPEQESTDEREGIGIGGLAAAAAGVAALMDDEDTQPIPVAEEPEPVAAETEIDEEELAEIEAVEAVEAEVEGEVPPTSELEADEDAAMAWLESLAAKQGAAEEELLTPAEQRQEEPPEWIKEAAAESEEPETDEQEDEQEGILAAAALAGMTESLFEESEPPEEDEVPQEAEPSEWVPEILPESDLPLEVEGEPAGEISEPSMETEEIAEEPGIVEELAAAAEVDLEEVEPGEAAGEIPDWLSGLAAEQELVSEDTEEAWTPPAKAEEPPTEELPEAAPLEKMDLNAASLAQLEKIPGVGFIHAQNIIEYRSRTGPFSDFEQLQNVEGLTPELVTDLQEYLTIELVPDLSPIESDIPELQSAWDHLNQGEIDQAVDQYTELINQDQHLDEIIRDLQAALGKYPLDSSLFQSLGDAYMHANMLQEALDAYNRAEDLLN